MCPPFCRKTHSRRRRYSLMPDACETFRHASLHIKSPTCTTFAAVQVDRGRPLSPRLLIHCCCRFYSATYPGLVCSTFYAEIPVVVVETEIRVAGFRRVAPLCVINFMRLELTVVFGRKRHWSLPKYWKLVQAFWRREQSNAVASRSGLVFGPPSALYNTCTCIQFRITLVYLKQQIRGIFERCLRCNQLYFEWLPTWQNRLNNV